MLRVIGDIHGRYNDYRDIISDGQESVQLGDMGLDYGGLKGINPDVHKFLGGNHDNYDRYSSCPNSLGDYGKYVLGGVEFFFIRGAFSIDWKERVAYQTAESVYWWEQEQLRYQDMADALERYKKCKPNIMMTHTAPRMIADCFSGDILRHYGYNPNMFTTNTQELLQQCWAAHQPKLWLFGHFHRNLTKQVQNTTFRCVAMQDFVNIDKKGDLQ